MFSFPFWALPLSTSVASAKLPGETFGEGSNVFAKYGH